MTETTLLPQSVRLFSPSASTEIMPESAPTAIFAAASRVFSTMPSPPENLPTLPRTAGEAGVSPSLTNSISLFYRHS